MKIHYEPFPGFNKEFDFMYPDTLILELSFTEPEEPKLLKEIGVDYIVEKITKGDGYSFEGLLMKQLLPEQIRVLLSHTYRVFYYRLPTSQPRFVDLLYIEFQQIAKQEIEPGIFKDEDIL
jgi:hypothetical protein